MHKIRFITIVLISAVFFTGSLVIADQICIPVGNIPMEAPEGVDAQRAKVIFPHSDHFGDKCQKCHHTWDGESPVSSCMAKGCHDQTTAPEKSLVKGEYTDEALKYYKYAYHLQCKNCHLEIDEKNKIANSDDVQDNGPTGCNGCHPKD